MKNKIMEIHYRTRTAGIRAMHAICPAMPRKSSDPIAAPKGRVLSPNPGKVTCASCLAILRGLAAKAGQP